MEQDINKLADVKVEDGLLVAWSVRRNRLFVGALAAVCLSVAAVYWPVLSAKALSFDDNRYYEENPLVRNPSWESTRRFFTEVLNPSTVGGYYQPLTMTSLMIDYALSTPGEELRSFHRTSLFLHTANTALIIVLLYLLFGRVWVAAAAGLLFGVHPLTVESIAWVGERKTLLAAFFTLCSLVLYVSFVHRGKKKFYVASLAMYLLALLSKPTSTPMPVMLLLIDYWPLRRLKLASILEKVPFFVVGGISAFVTYISQERTASVLTPGEYGIIRVPLVICHNIIFYLWKMVWPFNLTSHYPFLSPLNLSQPMILIGIIGTCVLIVALLVSLRWTRAAMTGWLIFFVMVLPTMQALQFSDVIASDKFVYLPSTGILMILAAFLGWVCGRRRNAAFLTARSVVAGIVVLVLACGEASATRKYLESWKSSVSLWEHMVEVIPTAVPPRNNLGVALAEAGNNEAAEEQFKKVLETDPNDADGNYNMGNIMSQKGRLAEAKQYYEKALLRRPDEGNIYHALGVLLVNEGKPEEAISLYRYALRHEKMGMSYLLYEGLGSIFIKLGQVDKAIAELDISAKQRASSTTYGYLGLAMASKGQLDEAEEYYKKAVRLDSRNAEAHYNYGNLLLSMDKPSQAAGEYEKAVKAKPNYAKAYGNLAIALSLIGKVDEAIETNRLVIALDPNDPSAYYNLAGVLEGKGQVDEAIENLRKVIELVPDDLSARTDMAKMLLGQGKIEEAMEEFRNVLRIDPTYKDALSGLQKAHEIKDGKSPPQPNVGVSPVNP